MGNVGFAVLTILGMALGLVSVSLGTESEQVVLLLAGGLITFVVVFAVAGLPVTSPRVADIVGWHPPYWETSNHYVRRRFPDFFY